MLAYLAVESQRAHSREVLATLFWPDWPDSAALSNLRYSLSNLREALGERGAPGAAGQFQHHPTAFLNRLSQALVKRQFTRLIGDKQVVGLGVIFLRIHGWGGQRETLIL